MRRQALAEFPAGGRQQHAKALALDVARQQLANFRIVIDDENLRYCRGHGSIELGTVLGRY